jgi:hypothetical protein
MKSSDLWRLIARNSCTTKYFYRILLTIHIQLNQFSFLRFLLFKPFKLLHPTTTRIYFKHLFPISYLHLRSFSINSNKSFIKTVQHRRNWMRIFFSSIQLSHFTNSRVDMDFNNSFAGFMISTTLRSDSYLISVPCFSFVTVMDFERLLKLSEKISSSKKFKQQFKGSIAKALEPTRIHVLLLASFWYANAGAWFTPMEKSWDRSER